MTKLKQSLREALEPYLTAPAWCVAFSGGLDSTVLLHALWRWSHSAAIPPLRAVHVAHGLQNAANAWPAHCATLCQQLEVPFKLLEVQVAAEASVEQAARTARYAALAAQLNAGEVLLTAQHLDDQAETLLLRLLRGAGVRGLAAMPQARALGAGQLVRPLLEVSRAELEAYAAQHSLSWVEDPSNQDQRYARNFLRHSLLPVLHKQWPHAAQQLARSAAHLSEAQQLLDERAKEDLHLAGSACQWPWLTLPSLELAPLLGLSEARQRNALRYFLNPLTRLPDTAHWAGWRDLSQCADAAAARWVLTDGMLRAGAGRVWWLAGDWLEPLREAESWSDSERSLTLPSNGQVWLSEARPTGVLRIVYRQGGEQLSLAGRGRRDLKRLLNELKLPSFVRERLPLLYAGDRLIAVANCPSLRDPCMGKAQLHWCPPAVGGIF